VQYKSICRVAGNFSVKRSQTGVSSIPDAILSITNRQPQQHEVRSIEARSIESASFNRTNTLAIRLTEHP
jgi:hypothetical protein